MSFRTQQADLTGHDLTGQTDQARHTGPWDTEILGGEEAVDKKPQTCVRR